MSGLGTRHLAAAAQCVRDYDRSLAGDDKRFGPERVRNALRGENAATLVALYREMGLSGAAITRRRRTDCGFAS